ncbi:MAG: DnaA ATPase domain-containing protein [Syntrophales bacterium]
MPSAVPLPTSGIVILSGTSGSGKTKRMQTAAHQFSMRNGFDLLHCCALDLIQEMADAIKAGTFQTFRTFLMRLGAMFIDNVWFLQKRPRTAHAVFSLFEAFAYRGGIGGDGRRLVAGVVLEMGFAKTLNFET